MKKRILLTTTLVSLLIMTGCTQQQKVVNPNGTGSSSSSHGTNGNGSSTTIGSSNGTGVTTNINGNGDYQSVDPLGNGGNGSSTGTGGLNGNGANGNGSTNGYGQNGNGSNGGYGDNSSYGGKSLRNVYFDTNKYQITVDKLPTIINNANQIKPAIKQGMRVKIEGHCDARGTDEYNYALGLRRAKSTKDALIRKGIPKRSISLVSLGESSPECTSSSSESCYSKNRRVEFQVIR